MTTTPQQPFSAIQEFIHVPKTSIYNGWKRIPKNVNICLQIEYGDPPVGGPSNDNQVNVKVSWCPENIVDGKSEVHGNLALPFRTLPLFEKARTEQQAATETPGNDAEEHTKENPTAIPAPEPTVVQDGNPQKEEVTLSQERVVELASKAILHVKRIPSRIRVGEGGLTSGRTWIEKPGDIHELLKDSNGILAVGDKCELKDRALRPKAVDGAGERPYFMAYEVLNLRTKTLLEVDWRTFFAVGKDDPCICAQVDRLCGCVHEVGLDTEEGGL